MVNKFSFWSCNLAFSSRKLECWLCEVGSLTVRSILLVFALDLVTLLLEQEHMVYFSVESNSVRFSVPN